MKFLTEYMPLQSDRSTGHRNGFRDEIDVAGRACIGRTLLEFHVMQTFDNGIAQEPIAETTPELKFDTDAIFHMTIAHGGEAIAVEHPIFPQTLECGMEFRRVNLTDAEPWSHVIGMKLTAIDVSLIPWGTSHRINGFRLEFDGDRAVQFLNSPDDCSSLGSELELPEECFFARWLVAESAR